MTAPGRGGASIGGRRPRVLIVNAYFDELRRGARPYSVPQAMGPAYLAGAFDAERVELKLWNEQHDGPLLEPALLGWPDLLVLTGLTSSLDRMRQLAAYARTRNPGVAVAAGGPAVRALPRYSAGFLDYACTGDIEQMRDVAIEALGAGAAAEEMFPRFDLAHWLGRIGYAEASRYCNFRCAFCSLTGEKRRYRAYDVDYVRRQLRALGPRRTIIFIDNNFYGSDRASFHARVAMLGDLVRAGEITGWNALVTGDFFLHEENLALVKAAGCRALFSGVESFDAATLRSYAKHQNTRLPQVEMIRRCLDHGLMFFYGMIFDPSRRRVAELARELDFVTGTPEITLPSFATLTIPLLGTPYFRECLDEGLILPRTRLRDLDGSTLALRPLDPLPEALAFVRGLPTLAGWRRRVARHALAFARRYHRVLDRDQMIGAMTNALMLCTPSVASRGARGAGRVGRRTFLSTTETLDPLYTPAFRVDRRWEQLFTPTMVTDETGALAPELHADLDGERVAVEC